MTHRFLLLASLVPLVAVAACGPSAGPAPQVASLPASAAPSAAPTASADAALGAKASAVVIAGVARAPGRHIGRIIPVGGGNVVSPGGGNVVPVGGGNVIPVGGGHNLTLLAVDEQPLANATVFLADAAGQPYPGLPTATTDAEGRFVFQDVPAGYTFMVVAAATDEGRGKSVTLQTLVRSSSLGATTTIDAATSLVTLAVTEGQAELGSFNPSTFRTAAEATARQLTAESLPDLSDRSAILAKVEDLAKQVAELKQALDAVRQDLERIEDKIDAIDQKLNQPSPTPTPTPVATMAPPVQPGGGGMMPPPGPGQCMPVQRQFVLNGTHTSYPLVVHVFAPDGNPIPMPGTGTPITIRFTGPGPVAGYMPPCPARLKLVDGANATVAEFPNFTAPAGNPVTLPF